MKKIMIAFCMLIGLHSFSQTYTLKDVVSSLKTFGTHMLFFEGERMLVGSYDTVEADENYFKIVLEGELWSRGTRFGKLYQCISFDARDISNNITVVPYVDASGGTNRWDVVFKTKGNKKLIHFFNEQIELTSNSHFIRAREDVSTTRFMFISEDAAKRFKNIAKAVFK